METTDDNTDSVMPRCDSCGKESDDWETLMFTVRGASGGNFSGKVMVKGKVICGDCAEHYESI